MKRNHHSAHSAREIISQLEKYPPDAVVVAIKVKGRNEKSFYFPTKLSTYTVDLIETDSSYGTDDRAPIKNCYLFSFDESKLFKNKFLPDESVNNSQPVSDFNEFMTVSDFISLLQDLGEHALFMLPYGTSYHGADTYYSPAIFTYNNETYKILDDDDAIIAPGRFMVCNSIGSKSDSLFKYKI